jgi:hypothetical protein
MTGTDMMLTNRCSKRSSHAASHAAGKGTATSVTPASAIIAIIAIAIVNKVQEDLASLSVFWTDIIKGSPKLV